MINRQGPDGGSGNPSRLGERSRRLLLAAAMGRSSDRAAGGATPASGADRRPGLHETLAAAIRADTAVSLGQAGRRLQAAVQALAEVDAGEAAPGHSTRAQRVADAAEALWACVVQREALGLLDHRMLAQVYQVPDELWRRMGSK